MVRLLPLLLLAASQILASTAGEQHLVLNSSRRLTESDDDFFTSNNLKGETRLEEAEFSAGIFLHNNCRRRVRKSWTNHSPAEKKLYLEAVKLSLKKRYNVYFTNLHMDSMSSREAHDSCGFLMWHRLFGLAYEKMLQSLGPRFRCIMTPYWDIFQDYAKMIQGKCHSMEECSEFLQDFGGGGTGQIEKEVTIVDLTFDTGCCTKGFCSSFCESETKCSNCIPRGDWLNTPLPATADYASIVATLLRSPNYEKANKHIQRGIHNDFHDTAGSSFQTYASSSDPIFFPYHAQIDMLHLIYYKCGSKRDDMSGFKKRFSDRAFKRCSYHKKEKGPKVGGEVPMLIQYKGRRISVLEHPVLAPFFRGLGTKYKHLLDPTHMDEYSYTYDMEKTVRRLLDLGLKCKWPAWRRGRRLAVDSEEEEEQQSISSSEEESASEETKMYYNWYKLAHQKVMDGTSNDFVRTALQLEAMTCSAYDVRFTERQDFSQGFKEGFKMTHMTDLPRCREILNKIKIGEDIIPLEWRAIVQPFLDH